jgi:hypothetical protein
MCVYLIKINVDHPFAKGSKIRGLKVVLYFVKKNINQIIKKRKYKLRG